MKRELKEALAKIDNVDREIGPDDKGAAQDERGFEQGSADFDMNLSHQQKIDIAEKYANADLTRKEMERERQDYSERTDIELRKTYADNIMVLVAGVTGATFFFLGKVASGDWYLSDKILISVLLALVLEVIGLVLIITNYLFKNNPKESKTKTRGVPKTKAKSKENTL